MVSRRHPSFSIGDSAAVADLRVEPIRCVPALLREFDVEPAALLQRAGIDADVLADGENRVPFAAVGRLLLEARSQRAGAYYNVIRPDCFANWNFRLQVVFMFPK